MTSLEELARMLDALTYEEGAGAWSRMLAFAARDLVGYYARTDKETLSAYKREGVEEMETDTREQIRLVLAGGGYRGGI